jgi:hypothetical protein
MTINPNDLPDELVKIAMESAGATTMTYKECRAAIAAFLNGALITGKAREAKASKSYSSTKGECWIASDAWEDDWPVLILRLPEGGR